MKWNKKQLEAIEHPGGPLFVLAGAGSGKTSVLTARIHHLLKMGIEPKNILAITFTNKAALEMKERLKGAEVTVQTFHGLCTQILKDESLYSGSIDINFSVTSTAHSLHIIKEKLKEVELEKSPAETLDIISKLKSEMVHIKYIERGYFPKKYMRKEKIDFLLNDYTKKEREKIFHVYKEYQKELEKYGKIDVDDIVLRTVWMMIEKREVKMRYQEKFEHILIDEFQDLNHVQYTLIKLLMQKDQNITVVGDDAQTVYSFRGSDMEKLFTFNEEFEHSKKIVLDQNYRSTKTILNASNEIISHNINQSKKQMMTQNSEGEMILVVETKSNENEAYFVSEKIKEIVKSGVDYAEIAVFYRHNRQSRKIEESCFSKNIPFVTTNETKFKDLEVIKDLIAYLEFIDNTKNVYSFKRAIMTPKRGIGEKTVEKIIHQSEGLDLLNYLNYPFGIVLSKDKEKALEEFYKKAKRWKEEKGKWTKRKLIDEILLDIEYEKEIARTTPESLKQKKTQIENLKKLADSMEEKTLSEFLEEIKRGVEPEEERDKNSVTLSTIHAAKGLEYKVVFIIGMNEGNFPSVALGDDIEEERRLCYVAFTRAKEKLIVSYVNNEKNKISRFLNEFDDSFKTHVTWERNKKSEDE